MVAMAYGEIKIRNFEKHRDTAKVEDLERKCEVGPRESSFLFTNTMGDPICRVRNSPQYKMLVAELENEVVGVIRGSIKIATVSGPPKDQAKVGYILGLRVSPLHRRRGIGLSLVRQLEQWFDSNYVEYAYMATEKDNEASLKLFIGKLGFIKFRTPMILVNPVRRRSIHISSRIKITKIKMEQAEHLYRRFMGTAEFFPRDIDQILKNKLSLGTWVAYPLDESWEHHDCVPTSWAMLSVWNTADVFKLRVGKPSLSSVLYAKASSLVDRIFPWLRIPVLPDVFNEFGFYFLYGVHGEGPRSGMLVHSLCQFVHNLATMCKDCKIIVTEIGPWDALRHHIPHWQSLSCPEDLWCIKSLRSKEEKTLLDWTKRPHPRAIFVDPREV
ncbi:probable N-acetyltransferase HLS1-like [Magnolia sinica]|uniref:probable N-acetyltransferase HLS1-like n=1 Tax=Magnolia sinica TaxID=86752 RepID=UPI0026596BED|nr:probable N-acetyltransferase HLS1-like [Magnolia sinica]